MTVLTDKQSVLPREDVEVSGTVACMLTGEGITFNRGVTIERVDRRGDQKVCLYKDMATGDVAEACQRRRSSARAVGWPIWRI